MQITVVGFPKTGTKSIAEALKQLGYNVYDILEHYQHHGRQWDKLLNEGGSFQDFAEMYRDVDVVVDAPAMYFWEEILLAFPKAKVILNVREEDSWAASWKRQISQDNSTFKLKIYSTFSPTAWHYHKFIVDFQRVIHGFGRSYWPWQKISFNEMVQRRNYRQHNSYAMHTVPKDQVLVYRVTDGWEPLCQFLDIDMPHSPFPHENKSASFYKDVIDTHPVMKRMKREAILSLIVVGSAATLLGCRLLKKWTRHYAGGKYRAKRTGKHVRTGTTDFAQVGRQQFWSWSF